MYPMLTLESDSAAPHDIFAYLRIQKTFLEKENKLSIYKGLINDGIIDVKDGFNYQVDIITKDFKGNTSSIRIPVIGLKSESILEQKNDTTNYKISKIKFQKL